MNPLLWTVLCGLAAPAAVLLAAAYALGQPGARRTGAPLCGVTAAALFGGGIALAGWPPLPPVTTTQWIGYGALLAGAAACFAARPGKWIGRALLVAVLFGIAARPKIGGAWTVGQGLLAWAAASALGMGLWFLLERRARTAGPLRFSIPLGAAMGAGAVLFFWQGSLLLAQWGGLAALAVGALGLGAALRGRDRIAAEALGVGVPVYGLIAVNALWYTDLTVPLALVLVAALALPALIGLRTSPTS